MSELVSLDLLQVAKAAVRQYAEAHPRPPQVTQSQAAIMMNVSRPTIAKLVKTGVLKLNSCGLIPVEQIDAALAARSAS